MLKIIPRYSQCVRAYEDAQALCGRKHKTILRRQVKHESILDQLRKIWKI